ncbi:MAG: zinc ribbon domain-containing protein [Sedimentisphaerales bacterium]|nr:zinc ribbon domain-containing protein [Sedimentisphaerales bacterium]
MTDESSKADRDDQGRIICYNCLAENHPHADFCEHCGTPLSSLSTIDPIKRIAATGDTWRKAASSPSKRIVLIGMWLIFAPPLLFFVLSLFAFVSEGDRSDNPGALLKTLVGMVVVCLYGLILVKVTQNYIRRKRAAANDECEGEEL